MQLCRSVLQQGLLLSVAMVTAVFGIRPEEDNELKKSRQSEEHVKMALDSLNRSQRQQEIMESRERNLIRQTVYEKFPWMNYTVGLPNYFTLGVKGSESTSEREEVYSESAIVFVGRNVISQCMKETAERRQWPVSVLSDSEARKEWETRRRAGNNENEKDEIFHEKYKLLVGDFTFGLCQGRTEETKCAHFLVAEDPLQRAIRTYELCKREKIDPSCALLNANDVTLLEWTVHHGNYLLHQLSFHGNYCDANVEYVNHKYKHVSVKDKHLPCWFKLKLKMEEEFSDAERSRMTEFIVQNLEKWFTAVGLWENLEDSWKMFQHVLQVPFSKCFSGRSSGELDRQVEFSHHDNNNNRANRNSRKPVLPGDEEYNYENDQESLTYDYRVQRALEADRMIYKQAQRIFGLQKQNLLNKIQ